MMLDARIEAFPGHGGHLAILSAEVSDLSSMSESRSRSMISF